MTEKQPEALEAPKKPQEETLRPMAVPKGEGEEMEVRTPRGKSNQQKGASGSKSSQEQGTPHRLKPQGKTQGMADKRKKQSRGHAQRSREALRTQGLGGFLRQDQSQPPTRTEGDKRGRRGRSARGKGEDAGKKKGTPWGPREWRRRKKERSGTREDQGILGSIQGGRRRDGSKHFGGYEPPSSGIARNTERPETGRATKIEGYYRLSGKKLSAIHPQKPRKQEWHGEGNQAGSHPRGEDERAETSRKVWSPRKNPRSGSRKKKGPHGWD